MQCGTLAGFLWEGASQAPQDDKFSCLRCLCPLGHPPSSGELPDTKKTRQDEKTVSPSHPLTSTDHSLVNSEVRGMSALSGTSKNGSLQECGYRTPHLHRAGKWVQPPLTERDSL
ncbi:hypothetical protein SKAU_G00217380 [Synaphobranchus kaupii]|uniref:Uncharacterized protein n=1 Tax=Synaphobranchus kaupii TaxID=118154 RepID=A0A9Q1FAN8_SYNKA|nr:hypothetical protein SKAU_G00217380 [Synaphobranchus kaupii]